MGWEEEFAVAAVIAKKERLAALVNCGAVATSCRGRGETSVWAPERGVEIWSKRYPAFWWGH